MTDPVALRELWRRVPVDDVGYLDPADLLTDPDDRPLLDLVERMARVRYQGWRNHDNRYRDVLGLDTTHGMTILDYGCGVGLDALQYAQAGNLVVVADLHPATVRLALRVLDAHERPALSGATIRLDGDLEPPYPDGWFDVIHMSGVLHHIPDPHPVLLRCHDWLRPGGELRLLLYSDQAWLRATRTPPPEDVTDHPALAEYGQHMDMPGSFADWYDPERLAARTRGLFTITRCFYAGPHRELLLATLQPATG